MLEAFKGVSFRPVGEAAETARGLGNLHGEPCFHLDGETTHAWSVQKKIYVGEQMNQMRGVLLSMLKHLHLYESNEARDMPLTLRQPSCRNLKKMDFL